MELTDELRARRIALPGRGGSLAALDFGSPERPIDIVFLHANGFNARTYRSILAPLAEHLRILAVDQRGHGHTDLPAQPDGRAGWDDFTDDLLALLDQENLRNVVLAGHSMGGAVSLLAAERSDRARELVLFDPVIPNPSAPAPSDGGFLPDAARKRRAVFPSRAAAVEAYTGRGAFRTWPREMLEDYVADGFAPRSDGEVELACAPAWEASNFAAQANETWRALLRIEIPVQIFRADHGSTFRIEGREAELAASDHVRVKTMPGSTHFLPMEQPDLVRAALRAAAG